MKRRLFSVLMLIALLLSLSLPVLATEATEETAAETTEETVKKEEYTTATSGSCGKDITWKLEGHTLTLSGSGAMDAGMPWEFYKDTIYTLILDGEITTIGDGAFSSCNNLQYIDFGSSLKEIGYQAFFSCNALKAFRLPDTFRKFGQECFKDCDSLQVIFCEGPMPSFKANCLYTNHTVQIFFTKDMPWPQEEIDRLRANFGARIYVDVGTEAVLEDYLEDRPTPTEVQTIVLETQPEETAAEETAAPTQPQIDLSALVPTEAPTAPVTVPQTQPPVTEAATVPTVPQTQPQPTVPVQTEPVFVDSDRDAQESQPEDNGSGTVLWVLLAAAVITAILILLLLIRMVLHSGGRYED